TEPPHGDPPRLDAARGARAARSPAARAGPSRADGASRGLPGQQGPALLAALGQDRRLPRGLRLLPAGGALPHRRRGGAAAPRRRSARRRAQARDAGATRFCMGAAWREVKDGPQFDRILEMVRGVKRLGMEACCTLGMLSEEQARRLKAAGLDAYNHNLDTSSEKYADITSTRVYHDR